MAITDPLLLPADILLVPVRELPETTREHFEYAESDYAMTRPRARATSRIIDAQAAALIEHFRTPTRIVDAVIAYSRERDLPPNQVLDGAYPLLQNLIDSQLLVAADSELVHQITPSCELGESVAGCEIVQCIQVLEDTELYRVRCADGHAAALKILRPGSRPALLQQLEREAAILARLDGKVNPALIAQGHWEDCPYLLIEWCQGDHTGTMSVDMRRTTTPSGRRQLLGMCCAVSEAYAHLHAQGVLHGDIHPRNILVQPDGAIKLIDFGLARLETGDSRLQKARRGGIGFFFEPEYADARRHGQHGPPTSPLGEQYALAALLYSLLSGEHYLKFSLEKTEMLRQIVEEPPLPFAAYGVPAWPEVEQVLTRALSKQPHERFPSVAAMSAALRAIYDTTAGDDPPIELLGSPGDETAADGLLEVVLQRVGIGGPLLAMGLPDVPRCSVTFGSAGLAYGLYRIACAQGDAKLLSLSDIWLTKTVSTMGDSSAFYSDELTPEVVGPVSPYYTASGVHCVRALVSHAMGDLVTQQAAVDSFVASVASPSINIDLTLGNSGLLIATALLLDVMPEHPLLQPHLVRECGDGVMRNLWAYLNTLGPLQTCSAISFLGIAHGWAGLLYATLRWCEVSGSPLPDQVEMRLQQLADCGEPIGRGMRWRRKLPPPSPQCRSR